MGQQSIANWQTMICRSRGSVQYFSMIPRQYFPRLRVLAPPEQPEKAKLNPHCSQKARRTKFIAAGFSLLELLAVIAIIALMTSIAIPAFSGIMSAKGVGAAASQIRDAVETARAHAVGANCFVWLALEPGTRSGQQGLHLALLASTTPSPDPTNIVPVGRPVFLAGVDLVGPEDLDLESSLSSTASIHSQSNGIVTQIGAQQFSGKSITFTPAGEAMLAASPNFYDGFDSLILVGLKGVRGLHRIEGSDTAITVAGSSATPAILRKEQP